MQRAVPVAARFVRVDGSRVEQLAGRIDNGDLAAGADAGVDAHRRARAGRRGEQQIVQVGAEDADRLFLGALAQGVHQVEFEVHEDLDAPGPAHGVGQPLVGRTTLVGDAEMFGDARFAGVVADRLVGLIEFGIQHQCDLQRAFVAPAEESERAVRRYSADRLRVVEVVAEFGALGFLAFDDGRFDDAVFLQIFAQLAEQRGVFRELLHEDLACAVEHGLGVGKAAVGVDEVLRFVLGFQRRVGEQCFGERREAGFAGDLRLGAALGFVREVEVFEALLGFGAVDLCGEVRREFSLFVDRGEDRGAALFEFAQVGQALVERAQLRVVQPAGDFLAVAGDERHGRAFVEQADSGDDLVQGAADFFGDLLGDAEFCGGCHQRSGLEKRANYAQSGRKTQVCGTACARNDKCALLCCRPYTIRVKWGGRTCVLNFIGVLR